MKIEDLEGIGLTRSEIIVYLTLLKTGQSSTGKIVKEAKISSGKIYEILNRLIEKGLVSYILKNNVKHFSASDPEKIEEYLQERKNEIDRKTRSISKIIPEIRELRNKSEKEYSAEIFTGFNGFKTVVLSLAEHLRENEETLHLGIGGGRSKPILRVWERFSRICNKKKIISKCIVSDISKEALDYFKEFKKIWGSFEYRFLPGLYFAPILVAGNKTMIFNFKELSVIVITSSTIAEQFVFFFNSIWKIAKPS